MFFADINFLVVIIAAIVSMVIGLVWYSPWVFGKVLMDSMGLTSADAIEKAKNRRPAWKVNLLICLSKLVMAYTLAVIINSVFVSGLMGLVVVGLVVSIGFMLSGSFVDTVVYERSWKLYVVNGAFSILSLCLMSIIIGLFS